MLSVLMLIAATASAAPDSVVPRIWNTSLIAQGWRPGVKVGGEYLLSRKTYDDKHGTKRHIVLEPSVSAWHHWGNHTPITASAQLYRRKIKSERRTREMFVGLGATYAINAGTTYAFDDSGELTGSALAGNLMAAVSAGVGIGRTPKAPRPGNFAWHLRPTVTIWAPYTSGVAPVFTLEAGVRWGTGGKNR